MVGTNGHVVCFSFDFQFGAGHIYVNKRNVERERFLLYAEKPARWVSKYGSITFNLVGRDWPHDGMNEAGLVVLSLGLDETRFPKPDDRLPIDENGWIQYQLDNSATLHDVLESMKHIRISSRSIGDSHFLLCDSSGASMVVEYVDSHCKTYTGDALPYAVLTNDTYEHLLAYLTEQKRLPVEKRAPYRVTSSCCRFLHVAEKTDRLNVSGDSLVDYGFNILDDVRQSNSQYQVVYDPRNHRIHYRALNSGLRKTVSFADFSFDSGTDVLMAEIQSARAGNLKDDFVPYDRRRAFDALIAFNKNTFEYLPNKVLESIVDAPTRSRCLPGNSGARPDSRLTGRHNPEETKGLSVSFQEPPAKDVVLRSNERTRAIDLAVKLNSVAPRDLSVVLALPEQGDLVPGRNVFVMPNPLTIPQGSSSGKATVVILREGLGDAVDSKLAVNLISDDVPVSGTDQILVRIRRESETGNNRDQ